MYVMNTTDQTQPSRRAPHLPFEFRLEDGRSCLIRKMSEDDAEIMCAILPQTHLESDFLNYMPGEFNMTLEQEREFIRDHNAKPCSMAIAAELDGRIIGYAGAFALERKRYAHHAEFGLTVVKAFWGLGLGRGLTQYAIDWGRDAGLRKLYLKVFDTNVGAIKLYESLGFAEEARLQGDWLRADGSYGDTIIMSVFYVTWA